MTVEQTRQLGIEFERRVLELIPNTTIKLKLDTDTIYSFLNEYQNQYVKETYLLESQVESNTRPSKKISDLLKSLTKHKTITTQYNNNQDSDIYNVTYKLPTNYFSYIRSNSIISKTYKNEKAGVKTYAPNILLKEDDIEHISSSFYNNKRIMRNPIAVLESSLDGTHYIKIIHDEYTKLDGIDLIYLCQPYRFNIIGFNDEDMSAGATHSSCELPFNCFDELVSGAVKLYINHYKLGRTQEPLQLKLKQKLEDEQ